MKLVRTFLFLLLLVAIGCGTTLPDVGGEGQKCFDNGTCKDGLECMVEVCYVQSWPRWSRFLFWVFFIYLLAVFIERTLVVIHSRKDFDEKMELIHRLSFVPSEIYKAKLLARVPVGDRFWHWFMKRLLPIAKWPFAIGGGAGAIMGLASVTSFIKLGEKPNDIIFFVFLGGFLLGIAFGFFYERKRWQIKEKDLLIMLEKIRDDLKEELKNRRDSTETNCKEGNSSSGEH